MWESGRATDRARNHARAMAVEPMRWGCHLTLEKRWHTDDPIGDQRAGDVEVTEWFGNVLANGGMSLLWQRAITLKPSTNTTGATLQALSSGNAALCVGISTATAAASQTDLQAATGSTARWFKGMEAGFPDHTDTSASSSSRQVQFKASYGTTQANFTWNEWGVFNDPHTTGPNGARTLGRMLNRKVQNLGTKTTAATFDLTVTLTVS